MSVDFTDNFRFNVIKQTESEKKKTKASSGTEWVSKYKIHHPHGARIGFTLNIIDTPGFGDTRGINRDFETFRQVQTLFKNTKDRLNAVCIVIQNSCARLTETQRYIFESILSIFGNNIKDSIYVLVTFADKEDPPAIDTLKEAQVPFSGHFIFNSSALYAKNKIPDRFTEMFWNLGVESFEKFTQTLSNSEAVSLDMTRKVLDRRYYLNYEVRKMQEQVEQGLCELENIQSHKAKLSEHKDTIHRFKNFKYFITKHYIVKVKLPEGLTSTKCDQCNYTCHFECEHVDKKECHVMDSNGYCKQCPDNCYWESHSSCDHVLECKTIEKEAEFTDMIRKYGVAKKGSSALPEVLEKLEAEYAKTQENVAENINSIKNIDKELKKIALRPNSLNLVEYIDFLIETEEKQKRPGYPGKIREYRKLKSRRELLNKIESDNEDSILPTIESLNEDLFE